MVLKRDERWYLMVLKRDEDFHFELGIYLPKSQTVETKCRARKRYGTLKTSVQGVTGRDVYLGLMA